MEHLYSIASDTLNSAVYSPSLEDAIVASSIAPSLDRIDTNGDELKIVFTSALSSEEITTLASLVSAHDGIQPEPVVAPQEVQVVDTDGDTGAIKVTNNFAPPGYYQRLHEIEFTTSITDGAIHDKDENDVDHNWSSVAHYEDISGTETLMVSPTQADLDARCIRTDFRFMPDVDFMIKSGTIAHNEIPASEVYVWGTMLDTEPALQAMGINPIVVLDGGLAMTFVAPRTPVGLRGVNGSLLFHAGVNTPTGFVATPPGLGTNRIKFICRHSAGFQHRFQAIFEIFRTP